MPSNPYGYSVKDSRATGNANIAQIITDMNTQGATWLRYLLPWYAIDSAASGDYTPGGTGNNLVLTTLDALVQACNTNGINLLLVIGRPPGSGSLGTGYYTQPVVGAQPSWYLPSPAKTAAFALFLATRYNGSAGSFGLIAGLDVGHEDYDLTANPAFVRHAGGVYLARTLVATYALVKAANPNCLVLAGALVTQDTTHITNWLSDLYNGGGFACCDALTFHFYKTGGIYPIGIAPESSPAGYTLFWQTMAQTCNTLGVPMRIWTTETGYSNANTDSAHQSQYLIEIVASAKNSGVVDRVLLFTIGNNDPMSLSQHGIGDGIPETHSPGFSSLTNQITAFPNFGLDSNYGAVYYFSSSNPITNAPLKLFDLLVGGNRSGTGLEAGLVQGGPIWLRAQAKWQKIEFNQTTPPTYDWAAIDNLVDTCNANNILLDLTIQSPPQWHFTVDFMGNTVPYDGATFIGTLNMAISNSLSYSSITVAALTSGQTLVAGQQLGIEYGAAHQENVLITGGPYGVGATAIAVKDIITGAAWFPAFNHTSGVAVQNAGGQYPGIADTLAFARAMISRYNNTATNYVSGLAQTKRYISAVQMNEDYDLWGTNLQRDVATQWFVQLWQTVGPELRAHLPATCRIVGPACRFTKDDGSGGTFGLAHISNWFTHFFTYKPAGSSITGCMQWIDALDFHWYRVGAAIGDPDPADTVPSSGTVLWPTHIQELAAIKAVASANGYPAFDVWNTEVGWAVFDDGTGGTWTVLEQQQADFFCGPANVGNLTGKQGIYEQQRLNNGSHIFIWTINSRANAEVGYVSPNTSTEVMSIVQNEAVSLGGARTFTKLKAYTAAQNYILAHTTWGGSGVGSPYKTAVLADSPRAYYRLDEASGTVASDSSGNAYTATYAGSGVTYSQAGALSGDSDTAVLFNGTAGEMLLPAGVNLTGWTKLSLETWVKFTNVTFASAIALFANDHTQSSNNGVSLNVTPNAAAIAFSIGNGTTHTLLTASPGTAFAAGVWYSIAATWDGTTMTVYINGASIGTATLTGAIGTPISQLGLGYNPTGTPSYATAAFDEAAVYPVALSPARVLAHYQIGSGTSAPPTLAVVPTVLSPSTGGVTKTGSTYQAMVTLSETSGSVGNANWTTASSLSGVIFTPATGTLSPGGQVTITISAIPGATGSSGTFTFAGLEGETAVTAGWSVPVVVGTGGFAAFANGAGTASFDHVRVTQYPDPSLSLAQVLPRAGQSLVAWDALVPNNTTLAVAISSDGVNWTDVTTGNGLPIPGITSQQPPITDTFTINDLASYTQTAQTGAAVWTIDTVNLRMSAVGGVGAALLNRTLIGAEWDITFDLDESDAAGCVFNWVDTQDNYSLTVADASSSVGTPNTVTLKKLVANVSTTLATASIAFVRTTIHRFRVLLLGGYITVSLDGVQLFSVADSSLAAGQAGLFNNGGTGRFYALWLCPQGQNVSGTPPGDTVTGMYLYMKESMTTGDPTTGPQLVDTTLSVRGPTIETGVLIAQLHSIGQPFAEYVSTEIQNLVSQNGVWWSDIDNKKVISFRSPNSVPAPFVLSTVGPTGANASNIKVRTKSPVKVTQGGDTFRNQQTILPLQGTISPPPYIFVSDGNATSWTVGYPIVSSPVVLVNGIPQIVGQTGIDVGHTFYWQPNNNTVTLGSGLTAFPFGFTISIAITGSYQTLATVNDPASIAARAVVEVGTSGIVESVYQIPNQSTTQALSLAAGTTMAQAYVQRFEHETTDLACDTTQQGLEPGQTVSVFMPEHGLWNKQLVIFKVNTSLFVTPPNGSPFYVYSIECSDGPNLGPWANTVGGH